VRNPRKRWHVTDVTAKQRETKGMTQAELNAAIRRANWIFSRDYRPNSEPPPRNLEPLPDKIRPELKGPTERSYEARAAEQMLNSEERFGQSHARLFPFIKKRVWTPSGMGLLLQVFEDRCEILLDQSRTVHVPPVNVRPIQ
jgi:hypothetical protein